MDLRNLGEFTAAKAAAEQSLSIAERAFGPGHREVAAALHTLATILPALGDYAGAMRSFERATRINEEALHPSDPETARASWFIRDLFPLSGYGPDDAQMFERMLEHERCLQPGDPRMAENLGNLLAVLDSPDEFRRTQPLFEQALEAQQKFLGPDHPAVAAAATNLAYVLVQNGDTGAAGRLYEAALRIVEESLGTEHPRVATALVNLGPRAPANRSLQRSRLAAGPGAGHSGSESGCRSPRPRRDSRSSRRTCGPGRRHERCVRRRSARGSHQPRAPAAHGSHASGAPGARVRLCENLAARRDAEPCRGSSTTSGGRRRMGRHDAGSRCGSRRDGGAPACNERT